ncbi:MAG: tyrosine--tRNA ligase [Planctomycetes bacterium]|nr:tyrosine--tRNA ligase [Planctomycetota bacterium]
MLPVDEQLALIRRGVEQIVPEDALKAKLQRSVATGKPLRVKYGIDPTGFDVHLGHTVPLGKLRLFQELGHLAVLIIGDYTARVGDPSGRDDSRKGLTDAQIEANAQSYLTQIGRIIDVARAEVRRNGEWFSRFTFADVLGLTGQITVQRMLERDDFSRRIDDGTPIYLRECLYPLMQGRDSVEIRADVELGGSEQLYNLLVGRDLQTDAGQEPQVCITMPILRGLDGEKKMGKSLGNFIGVGEPPSEQFGKTMKIPDTLMCDWFELLTDRTPEEITRLTDPKQTNPRMAKEVLGKDIVAFYHGAEAAEEAAARFRQVISEKKDPDDIPQVAVERASLSDGTLPLFKLLLALQLASSGNEARRRVQGGGVTIGPDRTKMSDPNAPIAVADGLIVRVGSRKIVKVQLV